MFVVLDVENRKFLSIKNFGAVVWPKIKMLILNKVEFVHIQHVGLHCVVCRSVQ